MCTSSTCLENLGMKTSTKFEACTQVEDFFKRAEAHGLKLFLKVRDLSRAENLVRLKPNLKTSANVL